MSIDLRGHGSALAAAAGFGAVLPAAQVFARNEIEPLQERFLEISEWMGEEVVRFVPYVVGRAVASSPAGSK